MGGRRDKLENELASPPVESQPPGNGARGGREQQDCLAPTSTLATALVPRWSKREAKVHPCHQRVHCPLHSSHATISFLARKSASCTS